MFDNVCANYFILSPRGVFKALEVAVMLGICYMRPFKDPIKHLQWCSGYHYCTASFNKDCSQVLRRFKLCLRRVGDLLW